VKRIRLIHWKATEAADLCSKLKGAGYAVGYDEKLDSHAFRGIRASPPDAFVIDLSRRPSHGREVAVYFRGQKATRQVPIVFVGDPKRAEAVRAVLPDAVYTTPTLLRSALRATLEKRSANPVTPVQMMDRYAARAAAQKLGIGEGCHAALIDPPRNYAAAVGPLPCGAALEESPAGICPVTLWFVHDAAAWVQALPAMRDLAARTKLWLLWRKGSTVTQTFLRGSAAAVGLVDYKICAIDKSWSGMLFTRKKER